MVVRVSITASLLGGFGWWAGGWESAKFLVCSVLVGALVAEVATGANFEIVGDLRRSGLVEVRMAGHSMYSYAVSHTVLQSIFAIVAVAPLVCVLWLLAGPPPPLAWFGAACLLTAGSAIGVLLAILTVRLGTFRFSALGVSVLLMFSGIFYDVGTLPSWMRFVCLMNPVFYMIDMVRGAWVQGRAPYGGVGGIWFAGLGAVCLSISAGMAWERFGRND